MAMESVNVLARYMLGARREDVSEALCDYEKSQRPRVVAAQENSRQLARMMFRRSVLLAIIRDLAGRLLAAPLRVVGLKCVDVMLYVWLVPTFVR